MFVRTNRRGELIVVGSIDVERLAQLQSEHAAEKKPKKAAVSRAPKKVDEPADEPADEPVVEPVVEPKKSEEPVFKSVLD